MSRFARTLRRFAVIGVLGALVVLVSAGPVAATVKSAGADTGWNLACFNGDCWWGRAHFFARWDRTVVYSEGSYSYWFTKFQVSGGIEDPGVECGADICAGWNFIGTVVFKNSAGATLKTIFPSGPGCFAEAWPGSWVVFQKCKTSFEVPYAATQVRITWLAQSIAPDNGVSGNWQATATAPI